MRKRGTSPCQHWWEQLLDLDAARAPVSVSAEDDDVDDMILQKKWWKQGGKSIVVHSRFSEIINSMSLGLGRALPCDIKRSVYGKDCHGQWPSYTQTHNWQHDGRGPAGLRISQWLVNSCTGMMVSMYVIPLCEWGQFMSSLSYTSAYYLEWVATNPWAMCSLCPMNSTL